MKTLKKGSTGDSVKTLQRLLGIGIDGKFGPKTRNAVKAYQTAHKLESDGIVGAKTWASLLGQTTTATEINKRPPDNKQFDPRWANVPYTSCGNKSQTIKSSACGPTAMCDIVNAWFDTEVTPVDLCKLSVANGFRTKNSGTAWGFFKYMSGKYAFSDYESTSDHSVAFAALTKGALVVASMGKGYWTSGGHFICLWKCDQARMYACDPASNTRTSQKLTDFKQQVKKYFIFMPPKVATGDDTDDGADGANNSTSGGTPVVAPPAKPTAPSTPLPTGIYDISKWQGEIDFKKLKESNKVRLLIVRAGYGLATKDQRFDEYMKGIAEQGIPFGVYWFSYAKTPEDAEREAASLYKIASPYKPLFYVMDAEISSLNGAMIDAFARKLRSLTNAKTGAYIANNYFDAYKADTSLWDFIWIPKYMEEMPTHRPCDLWQKEGTKLPGIGGNVDTNYTPSCGRYPFEWFLTRKESE